MSPESKGVEEIINKENITKIYYGEFKNFEKISDVGYFYISKAEWKKCEINVAVKAVKDVKGRFNQILIQE
ncbi:6395_t:CDS:1, partial [Dentiscutata heterogama]